MQSWQHCLILMPLLSIVSVFILLTKGSIQANVPCPIYLEHKCNGIDLSANIFLFQRPQPNTFLRKFLYTLLRSSRETFREQTMFNS